MNSYNNHCVIFQDQDVGSTLQQQVIGEEPLAIRVEGNPYSIVMRTPGDEISHVAGFCLSEGIVDSLDDFNTLALCDGTDTNVVTVTLQKARRKKIPHILKRKGFVSQTACGVCGKELISDLYQQLSPLKDDIRISMKTARYYAEKLSEQQPLRHQTSAAHGAAVYGQNFDLLAVAEDVGRHNALDKAIGKVLLDRKLDQASIAIISSRISYELVQKVVRARIPILLAISRPTALAIEMASQLKVTLACLAKGSGMFVYCGEHRFTDGWH